jgi:hypothetical protein
MPSNTTSTAADDAVPSVSAAAAVTTITDAHKLLAQYFNDASKTVSTPILPSLHSSFSEPIVRNNGDYEMTEEEAKEFIDKARRRHTTLINNWEKSGNGSSQRHLDDEDEEQEIDYVLCGHVDQQ